MSLKTVVMTPTHTNPSPRPRPQPVPPAAPSSDPPIIRATSKKADVPAPASASLVERPYAPVLPPATYSNELETVEALVGLASTSQQSPTTVALTSSFSAVNVAPTHNDHHDSYMRTCPKHDHACNISCRSICPNEHSLNTAQPIGVPKDIRSNDGSSSRARRRRRSNSPGIESPRGQRKPYDGHILKEDTLVGDTARPPRASSPGNSPQIPQHDAHPVPHQTESKQHSQRERQHLLPEYQSLSPRPQQALPYRSRQPTVRYAKQTNKPRMPNTLLPRTYTVDVHGFTVLRGIVPTEVAQAAAYILDHGMKEVWRDPTSKVFGLSLEARRVRDEFMRKGYRGLHDFHPPSFESLKSPMAINISEYLPAADPGHARYSTMQTANSKVVYVMVALTALHFNNGLLTLLGGSHGNKDPNCTPVNQWDHFQDVLYQGDVLIWRGDLKYLLSPHGGGRSMTMLFKWKPPVKKPVVDLTK